MEEDIKMMYVDDFTLFGDPTFLIGNFNIIVEVFAKVGLEVQPSKMKLLLYYPCWIRAVKDLVVTKGLVYVGKEKVIGSDGVGVEKEVKKCFITKEGVVIMGCSVGTDEYILNELTRIGNLVCPVYHTYKALHP